jgi:hypothetical protein
MTRLFTRRAAPLLFLWMLAAPSPAAAYSVLAHEAMIDAAWEQHLVRILSQRFPGTPPEALQKARAFAYGGSLIQDLGYYPFGSAFFSNMVHYVRSGTFVESLIREAADVNELAFALGALAHYTSDNLGHPNATNRAVPLLFPDVRAEFGAEALYADSPKSHVMTEFAFDVLQIARGTFKSDTYQDLIGFEVAAPVLERAFLATYGLELESVFGDVGLAIGTYRWAASQVVPDVTRVAWEQKRDDILAATPGATQETVVYSVTRREFEERYGATYRRPGLFARIVLAIFRVLPKIGPFKPLAFEPLTPETERMFLDSFDASVAAYRTSLDAVAAGPVMLGDLDLDSGEAPVPGRNSLADETYIELLEQLEELPLTPVTGILRAEIGAYVTGLGVRAPLP